MKGQAPAGSSIRLSPDARIRSIGWAVFLGISWTWCIGMFFPALLIRDYGLWGWIIFAIPNVVGAAAMGWTITAEQSHAITIAHREMVHVFGIVTAGFQIFFISWMGLLIAGKMGLLLVPAILIAVEILRRFFISRQWTLAIIGLIVSGGCAILFCSAGVPPLGSATGRSGSMLSEVGLAAACFVGFALCPYLDPSFHRARQATAASEAKWAFGIGFGVIFLSMIVFTLLYATTAIKILQAEPVSRLIAGCLLVHWVTQTTLTIGFQVESSRYRWAAAIGLAVVGFVAALVTSRSLAIGGELIYTLFMACYGLGFPAYVWLCMIPGRGRTRPSRRMCLITAIVMVIGMPFYWLAFIDHRMPFVIIGVAIVIGARFFVQPRRDSVSV